MFHVTKHLATFAVVLMLALSILENAGVLQIPKALPTLVVAGLMLSCVWTLTLGSESEYRDYLFRPLNPNNHSDETAEFFEDQSRQLRALGFVRLDDLKLQTKPFTHDVRGFIGPDRITFGSIDYCGGAYSSGLLSVFEDGMCLSTSSFAGESAALPSPEDHMQWQKIPGGTVQEIYQRHLEWIESYRARTGAEPLVFDSDDYQDVITYEHRLHWHWRYRRGLVRHAPPAAVLPKRHGLLEV